MCRTSRCILSFKRLSRRDLLRFSTSSRVHTGNTKPPDNEPSRPPSSVLGFADPSQPPQPRGRPIRYHFAGKASESTWERKSEVDVDDIEVDLRPAKDAPSSGCRNRGILLTGGTGGIGSAVAERLVKEGAGRVVLVCRSARKGNETVTKIKEQTKLDDAPISVLEADVTSTHILNGLLDKFPWCNTLINCAGISLSRLIQNSSDAEKSETLNTNLMAPMALSKLFLTHYASSHKTRHRTKASDRPAGFVENLAQSYVAINVSSLLAVKGGLGTAYYSASKAGLIAHTRALSLEAARYTAMSTGERSPFRANVILPGYIYTNMTAGIPENIKMQLKKSIPLQRFGSPEEVADAIVFLITNEYANNCVLNLDGGLSAT